MDEILKKKIEAIAKSMEIAAESLNDSSVYEHYLPSDAQMDMRYFAGRLRKLIAE